MRFIEAYLEFEFATARHHEKFDDPATHFLSNCLKAVDYIVELPDRYIFLEVKDPQHPNAQLPQTAAFIQSLTSKALITEQLRPKCCDSLLYKLATQSLNLAKPVYYYVLIALDTLSEAELSNLTDELKQKIPVVAQGSKLAQKFGGQPAYFVEGCAVLNVVTWNKFLGPRIQSTVKRL